MTRTKFTPAPPKFEIGNALKVRLNGESFPFHQITNRREFLPDFGVWQYKVEGFDHWIFEDELIDMWHLCITAIKEFEAKSKSEKAEVVA